MLLEMDCVYRERWAHTYILAGTIPADNRFDMDTWGQRNTASACCTSACLAGHAGLTPWFRREGFAFKAEGTALETENEDLDMIDDIKKFFGIEELARSPFEPHYCTTMLEIATGKKHTTKMLTPKRVQKVVKMYMLTRFGVGHTAVAIRAAQTTNEGRKQFTSVYNESFIHRHLGWITEVFRG